MDNKVNFLRGTATEYEASTKDNDTFYYTTDDEKLYLGNKEITGGGVTIDDTLSDTSENPVQNKAINAALNNKAELTDIPTSLPAKGGMSDTANIAYHQHLHILIDGENILEYATSDECHAGDIVRVKDSPSCPIDFGYLASDNDFFYQIFKLDNSWVTIKAFDVRSNAEFVNSYCNGYWVGWARCNDGGNADTVDGKHASDFALKTDIPTTLPAKGGNADTTNHQINHWLASGTDVLTYATSDNCPHNVNTKVRIMHCPTCPTNYGYNAADNDFWYDIYKYDNSWVQIKAYDVRGNVEFINSCLNGTWSGWVRCNDGGNAATANFATYSDYAGGSVQSTASNVCLRNISAGTADLSAGVSELATGAIYLVYE